MKKAVVLLSGGLDSATVVAIAKAQGFDPYALSFMYGQRHIIEIEAAKRVAQYFAVTDHRVVHLDMRAIGGSSLTSDLAVPKDQLSDEHVPNTYVPARNTIFLAYALAYAEVIGATDIFFGANAVDYSNYPDCRPEYVAAFEHMANLATAVGMQGSKITIHAPLMQLSKADIIRAGVALHVDYSLTHSCYDPVGDLACGHCDSCLLRKRGFEEAGVPNPTLYVEESNAHGANQA